MEGVKMRAEKSKGGSARLWVRVRVRVRVMVGKEEDQSQQGGE